MIENNYLWSVQPQMGLLYYTPSARLRDHYRHAVIITAGERGREWGVGGRGLDQSITYKWTYTKEISKKKCIWMANCYKLLVKIVFSVETIHYRIQCLMVSLPRSPRYKPIYGSLTWCWDHLMRMFAYVSVLGMGFYSQGLKGQGTSRMEFLDQEQGLGLRRTKG